MPSSTAKQFDAWRVRKERKNCYGGPSILTRRRKGPLDKKSGEWEKKRQTSEGRKNEVGV